jgi:hypothetical protein
MWKCENTLLIVGCSDLEISFDGTGSVNLNIPPPGSQTLFKIWQAWK